MEKKVSFIKERVRQIADNKGVKYGVFFNEIGVSPTGFRGDKLKKGLNSETIEKIISIYPDVNTYWLITGKGEMLLQLQGLGMLSEPTALTQLQQELLSTKRLLEKEEQHTADLRELLNLQNNSNQNAG